MPPITAMSTASSSPAKWACKVNGDSEDASIVSSLLSRNRSDHHRANLVTGKLSPSRKPRAAAAFNVVCMWLIAKTQRGNYSPLDGVLSWFGGLFPTERLIGSVRVDYRSQSDNDGFNFRWLVGNAGASSVPEPGTALIIGLLATGIGCRRRRS